MMPRERCSCAEPEFGFNMPTHTSKFQTQLLLILFLVALIMNGFKFAGDAMIVLWPGTGTEDAEMRSRRSVQCAVRVEYSLSDN